MPAPRPCGSSAEQSLIENACSHTKTSQLRRNVLSGADSSRSSSVRSLGSRTVCQAPLPIVSSGFLSRRGVGGRQQRCHALCRRARSATALLQAARPTRTRTTAPSRSPESACSCQSTHPRNAAIRCILRPGVKHSTPVVILTLRLKAALSCAWSHVHARVLAVRGLDDWTVTVWQ